MNNVYEIRATGHSPKVPVYVKDCECCGLSREAFYLFNLVMQSYLVYLAELSLFEHQQYGSPEKSRGTGR